MSEEEKYDEEETGSMEELEMMANKYSGEEVNTNDGVKIDFEQQWVHLRKSNTEPIIRIYTESNSQQSADELAERFITEITEITS